MKKILRILLKSIAGLIFLILVLLFTVPVIFKKQIKTQVENAINGSVNAKVSFSDYRLGFFKNFPNLSFSLENLYVVGINKFEGDTLAGFKSFDLVINLRSLIGKSGYEIKAFIIDRALVNGIVLKDGTSNWDIAKPSGAPADTTVTSGSGSGSKMKVVLRKVEIKNSTITYTDMSSAMSASLKDFNFNLGGYLTLTTTGLKLSLKIAETTFSMDGTKYLNKAAINSSIDVLADLKNMKFTLKDNHFSINDLTLNFAGTVEMPKDKIITDLTFGTNKTSFKTLLSLVPAIYMSDYKDLKASGDFALTGSAKGIYSSADSTLPDVSLNLKVDNGLISYPALPEKISNISINADVFADGKNLDRTTVNLDKFHLELAGSPFDLTFFLKTPMSDPDFKASMNGKIDLAALSKAVPMDSINLSGVIEMAVSMAGRLSMVEKQQYDKFMASGTMGIQNMIIAMAGYPRVVIKDALFAFTPAATQLQKADIVIAGTSDFSLTGNFENYIPYIFRNETVKGSLVLHSNMTDASAIMNAMSSDTSTTVKDTIGLVIIAVPKKIDFNLNASIEKFSYDSIKAEKVKAHVIVRDGILSLRETGMNILGGTVLMNADYDTRDTLKPVMKADFNLKNIGIKDAFTTFVIVKKLAPAAKGIDGKVNVQLAYQSLLGPDMMPVINTIDGDGKLQSDQVTLVESPVFDKIKGVLKLGDKYSNTFKDINISFKIKEGRVYVTPFDTKLGNIRMNIGGDQGLDQTLNYLVKTEIPRSDLGSSVNSLIDNLSSQAAKFGFAVKPADILKINVRVSGTFTKPEVAPVFGSTSTGEGSAKSESPGAVKQVVGATTDMAKDKLRSEAAAQGDKLISEAEAKGQQLRDEAAKAAEKIRQESVVQAQNLIKQAESKGLLAKAAAQKAADVLKKEADKRASQLTIEADNQAKKLVEEAKVKKEEMIQKI
jgi:hypothetical protein